MMMMINGPVNSNKSQIFNFFLLLLRQVINYINQRPKS